MDGTFAPVTLADFSGGWVSQYDREPDALRLNESPDLENVDFDGKGSFKIRRGYGIIGNRTATAGNILTQWTLTRPISIDEILIRQRGTTLEYYHTGTGNWETVPISGSLTADVKLSYANYTSTTDVVDYVYYTDGSIALQRWNGGNTQLNGALAGGEGTITVDSTSGFNAAGSIDIGGTTVTYTGKTGTTFTGCVGTPAAADNLPVEQIADAFAASDGSLPTGSILIVWNNQLVVANKQFIKTSNVDNFTSYATGASKLAFSKGFAGGTITALDVKDKKLMVHTTNSIQGIDYQFTNDLTGFQLVIEDIESTPGYGSKTSKGLCGADGETFFVSADNVIRRVIRSPVSSLYDTGSISKNIQNQLAKYTMTNAAAIFFKNKLYFAVQSDEASINDVVLVYDLKYARDNPSGEAWTKYRMYVSSWAVYGGALHFGSSAEPNSFRFLEDSNGNAYLDDDGAVIPWYYKTPLLDFGKGELRYRLKKIVSRGYISQNSAPTYTPTYDYGTQGEQEISFYGTNSSFVFVPALNALGEGVVGEEVEGSADDPFNGAYPFAYPFDVGTYDAYNIQVTIAGGTLDEQYKQTRLILYVEADDDNMTN